MFEALSRNAGQLHNLITNSERRVPGDRGAERGAGRRPSRSSRRSSTSRGDAGASLQTFAANTDPLIRDLQAGGARPPADAARRARCSRPDLRRLFHNLDPLIKVSKTGLPALRDMLRGLDAGCSARRGPFLSQLNPILQYLELNQHQVSRLHRQRQGRLAATTASATGGIGHYLRQIGPIGPETVGVYSDAAEHRPRQHLPHADVHLRQADCEQNGIFPNWDCKPTRRRGPGVAQPAGGPAARPGHAAVLGRAHDSLPGPEPAVSARERGGLHEVAPAQSQAQAEPSLRTATDRCSCRR